jgi:Domain of unknown function (DUF4365)
MRYENTSRIGVTKTDLIVTEKIGWIFREQPISDVGIDAIIEEVENGEPTGKFIAIQIKTGKGNFYCTEKSLVHYVSNIHYNYWLNLSIPIILVAHLPEENETYWEEITESNFKKNQKKWKIEIKKNQKFNEFSKSRLSKILSQKNDKKFNILNGLIKTENNYDLIENISCLKEATKSLFNISDIMNNQTERTKELNEKIRLFVQLKLSADDQQVTSSWKTFMRSLNLASNRIENEINIFSEMYSVGIFSFEEVVIQLKNNGITMDDLEIDITDILNIPNIIDYSLTMYSSLKESIINLNVSYKGYKESKKQYLETIELICFEMQAAKDITEKLIYTLKEITSANSGLAQLGF